MESLNIFIILTIVFALCFIGTLLWYFLVAVEYVQNCPECAKCEDCTTSSKCPRCTDCPTCPTCPTCTDCTAVACTPTTTTTTTTTLPYWEHTGNIGASYTTGTGSSAKPASKCITPTSITTDKSNLVFDSCLVDKTTKGFKEQQFVFTPLTSAPGQYTITSKDKVRFTGQIADTYAAITNDGTNVYISSMVSRNNPMSYKQRWYVENNTLVPVSNDNKTRDTSRYLTYGSLSTSRPIISMTNVEDATKKLIY